MPKNLPPYAVFHLYFIRKDMKCPVLDTSKGTTSMNPVAPSHFIYSFATTQGRLPHASLQIRVSQVHVSTLNWKAVLRR